MFSIRTKLLFLLLPVLLALLAGIGYFNYLKTLESDTRAVRETLRSIADARQTAQVEYIESAEKIGASIAANDIVQTYIELTNRNLRGVNNQETLERLGKRVENLLYSLQEAHWGRYHRVFLINRSNRIVISPEHGIREKGTPSSLLGEDMSSNPWAMGAMQKGTTRVSDYSIWEASDRGQLLLFYPVRDASNRVQAVIGIELLVPYQQQLLTRGFSYGESGRIYLLTARGVPVGRKDQAPLSGDLLTLVKLNGISTGRRLNAQGREVFGHYVKHEKYPWILATEIESGEIFAGLYELHKLLIAGLAVTVVLVSVLLWLFANTLTRPLRELTSQVERISLGEFNIEIPDTRRKDEIGKLIEAMQRLVFSLQLVSKKLRQAKAFKKAS
jgi:methyl-accepting chemotaxis protein